MPITQLPTIRQLECLVAVARTLNFRQAAEACFITQPALSAQIHQLEALLGVRLFERDRRKVLITSAGEAMLARARASMAELQDLADAATTYKQPLTGIFGAAAIRCRMARDGYARQERIATRVVDLSRHTIENLS